MEKLFGYDQLVVANIASGLQLTFTKVFKAWLYFEKHFLYPTLIEGQGLTKEAFELKLMTTEVPMFILKKGLSTYRMWMRGFWKMTCASSIFEVKADRIDGYRVICKTSNIMSLKKVLFGRFVCLSDTAFSYLQQIGYNSLVEINNAKYILYGPLQFVNHCCDAYLSLTDVPRGFSFKHEYEKDSYSIPLLVKHEELLIKYACKAKLWFVCKCRKCVL